MRVSQSLVSLQVVDHERRAFWFTNKGVQIKELSRPFWNWFYLKGSKRRRLDCQQWLHEKYRIAVQGIPYYYKGY